MAEREHHRHDRDGRGWPCGVRGMGEVLRPRQVLPIPVPEGQDLLGCCDDALRRVHDNLVSVLPPPPPPFTHCLIL